MQIKSRLQSRRNRFLRPQFVPSLACFGTAILAGALPAHAQSIQYSMVDLGLINGYGTSAAAINASGQVLINDTAPDGYDNGAQAYTNGTYFDFTPAPFSGDFGGSGIADDGNVVGTYQAIGSYDTNGAHGYIQGNPAPSSRLFSYSPPAPSTVSYGYSSISHNDAVVAGSYENSSSYTLPFIENTGGLTGFNESNGNTGYNLYTPTDHVGGVVSVNNSAVGTGYVESLQDGSTYATVWNPFGGQIDSYQTVGALPGNNYSVGTGINDKGVVVGWSGVDGDLGHAFVAHSNGPGTWALTDINSLDSYSFANAINSNGLIVGQSIQPPSGDEGEGGSWLYRGYLYLDGQMLDLNSLLPVNSGMYITSAIDINNNGQIAANGVDVNGVSHALLLNPVSASFSTASHLLTGQGSNESIGTVGGTTTGGAVSGTIISSGGTLTVKYNPQLSVVDLMNPATLGAGAPNFEIPGDGLYDQAWVVSLTDGNLGQANLTFQFDPTQFAPGTDLSLLRLYHFDETLGQWVIPDGETVDLTDDTINVTTTSFSPFVLGDASVPEPTSVMMLMGTAAIALKRRRRPMH